MQIKKHTITIWALAFAVSLMSLSFEAQARRQLTPQDMLPEDFRVYTYGSSGVINHPDQGTQERILPTSNLFTGSMGCYVACYTHNQRNGVYPVSDDIFVASQIRVKGGYTGRICKPYGYERSDISASAMFKTLCEQQFPGKCAGKSCWAGGDTGGWYGIQ